MTLHPTDIERLAHEWAHLQAQIEPICDRIDEINQELRDNLDAGKHAAGNLTVEIRQGSRFDKTAFTKAHPVTEHPDWYEAVPKLAAIKNALAPAELDSYYVPNKPSVVIS